MKDTTGGYIGVFKITVLEQLEAGAWYDAWRCGDCGAVLTLGAMLRPGPGPIGRLAPEDSHVRIACPKCKADRLYGINEREVVQVLTSS